jgi:isoquinoline 1-oxidoreductase
VQLLGAGLLIAVIDGQVVAQTTRVGRERRRGGRGGRGGTPGPVSARIHISKDGAITVLVGKVEAGQGARAELTLAAAEELRVPVERITLLMADTSQVPDDGITAGSGTTPRTVPAVREAAAAARGILVAAAMEHWKLQGGGVFDVRDGKVLEGGGGKREMSYGELVSLDEKVLTKQAPVGIEVTPVKDWKMMGVGAARPNGREIVMGAHRFPSDITQVGMLYGKVLRGPTAKAKLMSVDADAAKRVEGAVVVREGAFVGVAAPRTYLAEEAIELIGKTAKWESPEQVSSAELYEHLAKHAKGKEANPFAEIVQAAGKKLQATYDVAYVQHSPLEPRAACAVWEGDGGGKLTVWTGTQNPFGVRRELAGAFGIDEGSVRVIVPDFGGGFGGKHTGECAAEAARLAKGAGKPVSLRWTREEEFTWAYFRPAAMIEIEASLDGEGKLTSWHHVNINSGGQSMETPYEVGKAQSQFVQSDPPLRHGSYRALAATANTFAREVAMDELAVIAGRDPLAFRLAHLPEGRLKAVLTEAATKFNWDQRLKKKEAGVGYGVACGAEKGGYVAACVEVGVKDGVVSVREVCQAFECGAIVNPPNLMTQVAGAIVMGLGPALREEMVLENGAVKNARFSEYRVPRFKDLPKVDVHLVDRKDLPSAGAGECPIIAVSPAIANAVVMATGKRARSMPIKLM